MKSGNRHYTRQVLLQAVYQWHITQNDCQDIVKNFQDNFSKIDKEYFLLGLNSILEEQEKLIDIYQEFSSADYQSLDLIVKSILLIATYELTKVLELDSKIIINEAIELAKEYGADDSYKFINGVLEKVSHAYRAKRTT